MENEQPSKSRALALAIKQHQDAVADYVKTVTAIVIDSPEKLAEADKALVELKSRRDYFEALERPGIKAAHEAWKIQTDKLANHQKPILEAEKKIKAAIVAYHDKQERIRREEQARLTAEAEAAERERRQAEAQKLREMGQKKAAAAIVAAPVVVAVPAAPAAPMSASVNFREVWKFEIVSPEIVPRKYLKIDESMIAAVVKAEKGGCEIPGVRVWMEKDAVHKKAPRF